MREYHFYVYIMASRSRTLYIGFTSRLQLRVQQHKQGVFEGFTNAYDCHRLVYFEHYQTATVAIAREKQLKRWSRSKKIVLLEKENPTWEDLSADWGEPVERFEEPKAQGVGPL
jgi:putative endonuclease